ncbi:geobacter CxxxxCH...CXXCH motif protein [Geobacter sp. OR-1]|uniref:CxxxxCH/CxxCH domain c-type cytochrome n=1 Tax=Geobacter sp. OR-1 TaxID=1266765 RepID=UPI0005439C82|nr:CxxxxCH/CxxCH domain-containing protein [Geobacter sp. OR-1]GAM07815.1 geobacter CxxxxCH...CXXCH motif protein [Geobacter sp. OR-1]
MLRTFAPWFIAACLAFANPAYSAIIPDAPHSSASGFTCIACHASHPVLGGTGYNNICLNCHRPGFPRGGGKPFTEADMANPFGTFTSTRNGSVFQTSHAWQGSDSVSAAGALPPLQAGLTSVRTKTGGQLACVRCHNQHSNANGSFLRVANDQDQLCLDCHRQRNTTDHKAGTHPVGIDYAARAAGNPKFKGFSASSGLKLVSGKVLCSSCHGVHYTDSRAGTAKTAAGYNNLSTGDGNLLRTALRGAQPNSPNLCTACHTGKFSHNRRGQNVQCGDCHGGHVDPGDGTTPNVRLVNRQMRFSSTLRSAKNKPVFFQSTAVKNYKDANGTGVCQSCHDIPMGSGFQSFHNITDTTGCTNCHSHDNPLGTYSVDPNKACNSCHGYPPRANTAGGPDGYAAGSPFTNEANSGHATHASTPYQKACTECHNGNSHATGTFQDVFLDTAGSIAATGGLTPSYNAGTFTCANVYCHSNGAPRTGITQNAPTPATIPAWNNGKGAITGQPNASRCNNCHAAPIATNSHTKHINAAGYAIACSVCHSATVSGTSFTTTTISNQSNHTNGIKDVVFGDPATGGIWAQSSATCTNIYCHSNVQGASGSGAPAFRSPHWGIDNGTIGCGSCHANMATDTSGTGSHKTHAQAPYVYSCGVCHSGYTNASVVTATHVDNSINLSFSAPATNGGTTPSYYGGNTKTPGTGFRQCQNIYCHSTVQNATSGNSSGITYKTPTWGDAASVGTCGGCHVNMAVDTTGTGSHAAHARIYGMPCSECHSGAGKDPNTGIATPLHANGKINIAFSGTRAVGATYTKGAAIDPGQGFGRCTAANCHGQGVPTWGSPLSGTDCQKCHGDASAPFYSTAIPRITTNTDAKVGAHSAHLRATHAISGNIACSECHAVPGTLNSGNHMNGTVEITFGTLAKSQSTNATSCNTSWCHGGNTTSLPENNPVRTAPSWATPFPTGSSLGTGGAAGTSGTGYCAQCHGYPPLTALHAGKTAGQCTICHPHLNSDAQTFNNAAKHVNGTIDATGGHAFPYQGSTHLSTAGTTPWASCVTAGCHTRGANTTYPVAAGTPPDCNACHLGGLKVPSGTSSCWDCHGVSAANGLPNGSSFPNNAGSHSVHAALAGISCASCHTGGGTGTTSHGPGNRTAKSSVADVKVAFTGQGANPVWTVAAMTCSATNCHGQGAPTWGATSATPVNGFPYSAVQCEKCHGSATTVPFYSNAIPKVTANTDAKAGAHTAHLQASHTLSNKIACSECHTVPGTATAAGHMNGTTEVAFGTLAKSQSTNATSCSTSWCHGGNTGLIPQNNPARTAPAWATPYPAVGAVGTGGVGGTTGTGLCAQCHGYPPANALHAGKIATQCTGCHSHVNADATGFSDATKHINGTIDASGGHSFPYQGSAHLSAAGTTPWASCVTAGCHTRGVNTTYPVAAGTPPDCNACHLGGLKVPSGTSSCWDCHGVSATNGLPNGSSFPNNAGSHSVHAALAGISCVSCHTGGGTGTTSHGPGNRTAKTSVANVTVAFTGQGANPVWTVAALTCSATNCHGQGAPTWGATSATPVNGFPYSAVQCEKCHGSATTVPFYSNAIPKVTANTDAKAGAHTAHLQASHTLSSKIACSECHTVPGTVTAAGHMNGSTEIAFGTLAKSQSTNATSCSTSWCHGGNTGLIPQNNPARTAPSWATPYPAVGAVGTGGVGGTTGTGLCAQCHGYPPANAIHAGKAATACTGCHSHVNAAGTGFTDASKHINGTIDGGESAGGIACNNCHSFSSAMANDTTTYHHPVNSNVDYGSSTCLQCHVDHNIFSPIYNTSNPSIADRSANLRSSRLNTPTQTGGNANSDFGNFGVLDNGGICITCHTNTQNISVNQKNAPSVGTVLATVQYATYNTAAHQYTALSTYSDGTTFNANCSKCHLARATETSSFQSGNQFATHLGYDRKLLGGLGLTVVAGSDPLEQNHCFRCHSKTTDSNPGGAAAKTTANRDYYNRAAMDAAAEAVFSDFAKTGGRHNVAGYSGIHYLTEPNGSGLITTKHVECGDCHNPHAATASNHAIGTNNVSGVLTGVGGATPSFVASNWGGVSSYANAATADMEYKICLKCHNLNNISWGGTGAAAWTDLGLEFNPNNKSAHPVIVSLNNQTGSLAPKALTAAQMTAPWTAVGTQTMYCSDCHASDTAGSQGPHGSTVKWMLTGANKAWPYTSAASNGTSAGTFFTLSTRTTNSGTNNGLFCLNCHPSTNQNNVHSRGNHTSIPCVNCHIRVPHGGKLSRLITTDTAGLPGRYKPDGNNGAFSGGRVTQFKKAAGPSNYSESNCNQSGCSSHGAVTSPETW